MCIRDNNEPASRRTTRRVTNPALRNDSIAEPSWALTGCALRGNLAGQVGRGRRDQGATRDAPWRCVVCRLVRILLIAAVALSAASQPAGATPTKKLDTQLG